MDCDVFRIFKTDAAVRLGFLHSIFMFVTSMSSLSHTPQCYFRNYPVLAILDDLLVLLLLPAVYSSSLPPCRASLRLRVPSAAVPRVRVICGSFSTLRCFFCFSLFSCLRHSYCTQYASLTLEPPPAEALPLSFHYFFF